MRNAKKLHKKIAKRKLRRTKNFFVGKSNAYKRNYEMEWNVS